MLLQGFVCGEDDSTETYIVREMPCGGTASQATTVVSSFVLAIYVIFLYVQNYLYNSSNLETDLPWGSLDPELANLRTLWKFYLSLTFIFDKSGAYEAYT